MKDKGLLEQLVLYMSVVNFRPAIPDGDPRRREDKPKEKVFLEHYSWLMGCALGMTHGQREHAEDLVHDVFVQFLAKPADPASITEIRWYLNGILRNLHLLQLRRTTRHPVQQLSLFDHDSALIGLRVWGAGDQLESADLLIRACDFACYRKETALTASILILRFFHGYYPGEIALLLKARRKAVDQWIDRGRMETKQYIESPYLLPDYARTERKAPSLASSTAFLRYLRERIFDSCTSDCSVLNHCSEELGVKELAHLVSCRPCLESRSRKMGLPHIAERMPDDISDRDDGRPQGGGEVGEFFLPHARRKPTKDKILRQARAHRRELFEHRPKEMTLTFDGQTHATLLINASINTIHISLDNEEVPRSIGILSEQDFRFLILDHDDLTCTEQRIYRLPLSDDRSLEVVITPETLGISIHLVYADPLLARGTADAVAQELYATKQDNRILSVLSGHAESALAFRPRWWAAALNRFRGMVPALNPFLTSAILLSLSSVLCLVFWLRSSPTPTAIELLDHAKLAEFKPGATNRPGVICQKVAIRTKRRSIERTIYRDAQGIRHPKQQKLSPEDEQLRSRLASVGVSWDAPLSAADYADWRYRSGGTRDLVTRPSPHLLKLTTTPLSAGAVLSESLTVRDTDFHPVDRTVDLRDSGTIEVAELNYDVLPWGNTSSSFFADLAAPKSAPTPAASQPTVNTLETELAVRYALHGIGADLGEPIDLKTGPAAVSVVGIVSSTERKKDLLAVLQGIPHVTAQLQTEDEAAQRLRNAPVTRAEPTMVISHSPIEKELMEHLGSQPAVENFSMRATVLTESVMAHAWALRHLSQRYPAPGLKNASALSSSSRQLLQIMIRDHHRAMRDATSELTALLRPVFQSMVEVPPESVPRPPLFASAQAVQRLTLELLSGPESQNANERQEPAKAEQDLLVALRDLEMNLEEQP